MHKIYKRSLTDTVTVNSKWMTVAIGLILICIPFIQLGYQYYLSFMILTFVILISLLAVKDFLASILSLGLALFIMFLPAIFYLSSDYAIHNVLRTGREFLCFSVIYIFIARSRYIVKHTQPQMSLMKAGVSTLIIVLLCFTIIQYIFLKKGIGLYLPVDLYIRNAGTIPTALDLQWSRVRPSASFGEPSYLGFIITSLLFVVLHLFEGRNAKLILSICILTTALLANTLAGIVACSILLFHYLWISAEHSGSRVLLLSSTAFLILFVILSGHLNIYERISNIGNKDIEASGYYRIVVPMKVVGTILTDYPIGVPTDELSTLFTKNKFATKQYLGGSLSNGFFNIIINYGVLSLFIIFLLIHATRRYWFLVVYLFLVSMFNGGIFTYDKATIIGLTVLLMTYGLTKKADHAGTPYSTAVKDIIHSAKRTSGLIRRKTHPLKQSNIRW